MRAARRHQEPCVHQDPEAKLFKKKHARCSASNVVDQPSHHHLHGGSLGACREMQHTHIRKTRRERLA